MPYMDRMGMGMGNKKVLIFEVAEQRFAFTDVHDVPRIVDGYPPPPRYQEQVTQWPCISWVWVE